MRVLALHLTLLYLASQEVSIPFLLPARMELLDFLAGGLLLLDILRRQNMLTSLIDRGLLFDALIDKQTIAQVELLVRRLTLVGLLVAT